MKPVCMPTVQKHLKTFLLIWQPELIIISPTIGKFPVDITIFSIRMLKWLMINNNTSTVV